MHAKIKTGMMAISATVGFFEAPARPNRAPTIARHHVLHCGLLPARRAMIACTWFRWAIAAGLSAGKNADGVEGPGGFSPGIVVMAQPQHNSDEYRFSRPISRP